MREEILRNEASQRLKEGSTVVLTVHNSEVAARLIKNGVQMRGRCYKVMDFVVCGARSLCGNCGKWGHARIRCPTPLAPACILCAGNQTTRDHKCQQPGCPAFKGQSCAHLKRKYTNCAGDHTATDNICLVKRSVMRFRPGRGEEVSETGAARRVAEKTPAITILSRQHTPTQGTPSPTPTPITDNENTQAGEDEDMGEASTQAPTGMADNTESDY